MCDRIMNTPANRCKEGITILGHACARRKRPGCASPLIPGLAGLPTGGSHHKE